MVKYIKSAAAKITTICVSFDDNQTVLKAMLHDDLSKRHQWVPIRRTEASFSVRIKSFTIKRTQFPLTLSYACTIQKVQGLSCSKLLYVLIYKGINPSCQVRCMCF